MDKIAKALCVSRMKVYRVLRNDEWVPKPKKPRNVKFDSFDIDVIRRVVYEFYEKNELPTKQMIINILNEREISISNGQCCWVEFCLESDLNGKESPKTGTFSLKEVKLMQVERCISEKFKSTDKWDIKLST